MTDLTAVGAWTCASNVKWETEVAGRGGTLYTVSFGPTPKGLCQYDYHCTCKAFQFGRGKRCKHIKAVEMAGKRCGWNACLEPGVLPVPGGASAITCPECRGPVWAFVVGV